MFTRESIATADGLRSRARSTARQAAEARGVAFAIEVRRAAIGGRIEAALALHTAEVWDSAAARRSRDELQRGVALMIGRAREGARETRAALEREAEALDRAAVGFRQRADAIEAATGASASGWSAAGPAR